MVFEGQGLLIEITPRQAKTVCDIAGRIFETVIFKRCPQGVFDILGVSLGFGDVDHQDQFSAGRIGFAG